MVDPNALEKPFNMDMSLDDIDDLPGFAVFPSGSHHVVIEKADKSKKIGDHTAAEISLKLVETLELAPDALDAGEAAPKPGDVMSIAFMLDNKFGVGMLKQFVKPIAEKLGTASMGATFDQMVGLNIAIVMKRTYNKDKDAHYPKMKNVVVL